MKQGWEYKKLGEVCHITMGQSPDGNSINDNEGVEFHQGKTCFGEQTLGVSNLFSNAPVKLAEAHSVLLCVRAPVGYPNITERKICIGRGLCALYAKEDIDNKFLFYSLLSKQSHFEKNATGSTFKAISSKVVSNTEIPIPPKSTQLAIVSELDKINELIRLKKEQLKDYDDLAQSIFYEMFGDPVENEKEWEVKKLKDTCDELFAGGDVPKNNYSKTKEGNYIYPIYTNGIVNEGLYGYTDIIRVNKDSLTISARGTIGAVFKRKANYYPAIRLITIVPQDSLLDLDYTMFALKGICIEGAGGTIPQLTVPTLKLYNIQVPPLPLQHLFAQRIEKIEHQKSEVAKAITDLETLLASRMQHWFE